MTDQAVARSGLWQRLCEILFLEHRRAREIEEKRRAAVTAARQKLRRQAVKAERKRRQVAARQQLKNRKADERRERAAQLGADLGRRLQAGRRLSKFLQATREKAAALPILSRVVKPAFRPLRPGLPGLTSAFAKAAARPTAPEITPPPIEGGPRRLRALFRSRHFAKLHR